MSETEEFTTETAREAAANGDLTEWVKRFLASPGSDNAELAELLHEDPRWWVGPVQIPIDQLHRLAGPPGAPVVEKVDNDYWRDDVEDLADKVDDGLEPAPVIATKKEDHLMLEDGNHRLEAMRRAGVEEAWTIVGFSSEADRDDFIEQSNKTQ